MGEKVGVIGGGIVGLFSALALLEAGHEVTIFERDAVGQGSTHAAAGLLGAQAEWDRYDSLFHWASLSRKRWHEWAQTLTVEQRTKSMYAPVGILKWALSAEDVTELQLTKAWQTEAGVVTEVMDYDQMVAQCLPVRPDVRMGHLETFDGYTNPRGVVQVLVDQIKARGGQVYEQTPVVDVHCRKDQIEIVCEQRSFLASRLVIASGVWSNRWLGQFHEEARVYPVKGCWWTIESSELQLQTPLFYKHAYVVPR
ncbi:MAG: NAD(P)/FAD-dependent oxidoreductase, partial [Bacilli bacterium]